MVASGVAQWLDDIDDLSIISLVFLGVFERYIAVVEIHEQILREDRCIHKVKDMLIQKEVI